MKRKIKSKSQRGKPHKVRRERETLPWKYLILTVICALLLVVGFFGAARQHFASIDYGIRNSKLRKQVDELKSEQRRLLLSREVALSPPELKKAARKIGFREMTAGNIESFENREPSAENANIEPEKVDLAEKKNDAADKKPADKGRKPKTSETAAAKNDKSKKAKSPDKAPEKRIQTAQKLNPTERKRVQ